MKKILSYILILFIPFLFFACSGSKMSQSSSDSYKEVNDPLHPLTVEANKIIKDGGVAAVGTGVSSRSDIAERKARSSAQGNLAEIFNLKVQRLKNNFQEEVGQSKTSEVNELFSVATKQLTSKVLHGAIEKDYKKLQNKKGNYKYGVLMVVTPKTVNMSILDQMQKGKPKLYQRFRASQAFKELQKEMKDYEYEQQQNQ